jgi:hypothetical protein
MLTMPLKAISIRALHDGRVLSRCRRLEEMDLRKKEAGKRDRRFEERPGPVALKIVVRLMQDFFSTRARFFEEVRMPLSSEGCLSEIGSSTWSTKALDGSKGFLVEPFNEFLRIVVKVLLGRLAAVVGNRAGSARVSVCSGTATPLDSWSEKEKGVNEARRSWWQIFWRDLDLTERNEGKRSEERLKKAGLCMPDAG